MDDSNSVTSAQIDLKAEAKLYGITEADLLAELETENSNLHVSLEAFHEKVLNDAIPIYLNGKDLIGYHWKKDSKFWWTEPCGHITTCMCEGLKAWRCSNKDCGLRYSMASSFPNGKCKKCSAELIPMNQSLPNEILPLLQEEERGSYWAQETINAARIQDSRRKFKYILSWYVITFALISVMPEMLIEKIGFLVGPIFPNFFVVSIIGYFLSKLTFLIAKGLQGPSIVYSTDSEKLTFTKEVTRYTADRISHFILVTLTISSIYFPLQFSSSIHTNSYLTWTTLIIPLIFVYTVFGIWHSKAQSNFLYVFLDILFFALLMGVAILLASLVWGVSDAIDVVLDSGSGTSDSGGFTPHGMFCVWARGCVWY